MRVTVDYTGWSCTDCIILIANGDVPGDLPESMVHEWLARFDARSAGRHVVPGGEHDPGCPRTDCECDTRDWSSLPCDTCGEPAHGARHAVTFFTETI
jgi:hypothetical protein